MQFGVSESVEHWGKYRPDHPAVSHNGVVSSYRELNSLVDKVCHAIAESNFSSERVAIAVKSRFDLLVSLLSVLRMGKSVVLLNTELPDDAIRTNLKDANVQSILVDEHHERIMTLMELPDQKQTLNITDVLASAGSPAKNLQSSILRAPNDEWGVLFSSGTTGVPKGIERDHNSIVTELLGWCLELGLNRRTKFYIGRPIYYTGGLVLALSTLLVSGQIILNDFTNDNDPLEVWDDYQQVSVACTLSWAFFIPDQVRAFCKAAEKLDVAPQGAETILVMGGPISGDEKLRSKQLLGSELVESWGNTESLGTITDPEDLEKRPNSIGRPFLTDELYIVDDQYNPVGPNEYGRIAGNEEAGFFRYCNRPDATELVKQNALIISEDIGYRDEDGFFYVRGRLQECIVRNGETLFLPHIEVMLRSNESIKECCVAAISPNEVSVELIGVVVPEPGASINELELLQNVNSLLDPNKQLNRILFVESLPRVPSGKIDKLAVEELVKGHA